MLDSIKGHLANWKASPQKWKVSYMGSRLWTLCKAALQKRREGKNRDELLNPAIDVEYVAILFDPKFRSSVTQVKDYTCLDVARLANIWNLARLVGPGIFLEVGSFKGGTALHICNAIENRGADFYCFDPFEKGGFEALGDKDQCFKPNDFTDTRYEMVVKLLSGKPHAKVIQGYFPAAAEHLNLANIAFCHLDVDVYGATKESLEFLAPRLAPRGLIVLDDVDHLETPGVNKAVTEFLASHSSFLYIPMFPTQAVLLPKSHW
jgi:O-methyltransferase